MKQFMFEIRFSTDRIPEMMRLLPSQREYVDKMMKQNVISSYVLSLERSKLWVIVNSEDEEAAVGVVEDFPMYEFFSFDMFPVTFNNQVVLLPALSLN